MVKYLPLTAKHFSLKANTAILFYIPWNAKKKTKKNSDQSTIDTLSLLYYRI